MGSDTNIEWTDATWNPVRGCSRVSEGCRNCYAEKVAARFSGPGLPYEGLATLKGGRARWTGEMRMVPEHLDDPLRWSRPRRVFVNSMSDLFHEKLSNEDIAAVFGIMAAAPKHQFQVLTKRPDRARAWFEWLASSPGHSPPANICAWAARAYLLNASGSVGRQLDLLADAETGPAWPLTNVWLGVSVEDQASADQRIPELLATPAALRFLSAEPLLGPIRLDPNTLGVRGHLAETFGNPLVNWVIVGGESGQGARRFDLAWARQLVKACAEAGVPCFVKQLGAKPAGDWGADNPPMVHVMDITQSPAQDTLQLNRTKTTGVWKLANRKGGSPDEWPPDLRVREFPDWQYVVGIDWAAGEGPDADRQRAPASAEVEKDEAGGQP